MGILDDFINSIKKQREQFKAEQKNAADERVEQRPPAEEHRGPIQEFGHRIEEQRKGFKEAQKGGTADKGTAQTIQQQPSLTIGTVEHFGHMFSHMPGSPEHVWFDDGGKAVYIDDVDAFLKSGGKVEVRGISAAMEPDVYAIYTGKGGPLGQARYYTKENVVISIVPDPFAKYR
jgi:hypothetical protein